MGFKDLTKSVSRKVGKQLLTVRTHSPAILMVTGSAAVIGSVVLASRATLKLDGILNEAEELDAKVEEAGEKAQKAGLSYTDEDKKKDRITVRVKMAINVAKAYAPAVALLAVGIGCFVGSHQILNKRNAGLSAALLGTTQAFAQYRGRVVDELGKQKDMEFRYGVIERTIGVDTDEGIAEKTVRGIDQHALKADGDSMYAVLFDSDNPRWQPVPERNELFLKAQQNWANDLLNSRGHVFLNEVRELLGFDHCEEGSVVGWIIGHGDQEVDFGVFGPGGVIDQNVFANGPDDSYLVDFNVHGPIHKLLGKNKGK
jgi:hypothetical protein